MVGDVGRMLGQLRALQPVVDAADVTLAACCVVSVLVGLDDKDDSTAPELQHVMKLVRDLKVTEASLPQRVQGKLAERRRRKPRPS